MANRIAHLLDDEPAPEYEYWELIASSGRFFIAPDQGAVIARHLARRWPQRWLRFIDLFGSRVVIRTDSVVALHESTPLQRDACRQFQRRERADELREWQEDLGLDDDWLSDEDGTCPL